MHNLLNYNYNDTKKIYDAGSVGDSDIEQL